MFLIILKIFLYCNDSTIIDIELNQIHTDIYPNTQHIKICLYLIYSCIFDINNYL